MKSKVLYVAISLLVGFSLVLSAYGPADVNIANTENTANAEESDVEEANAEEADVEETEAEEAEAADVEETEAEETEAEESAEPMTLKLAYVVEPDTLDPHKTGSGVSVAVLDFVGSSLVYVDGDGNVIPYLAESWDVSEDGLVYTFHLRNDVTFHDGTPLTAQDFVYTYNRAIDPETASPAAGPNLGPVESFEAPDDYTFVITLTEPFYPFLFSISTPGYMQPMLQSYVEEAGEIDSAGIEPKDLALFEGLDFDILETPQGGLRPYIAFQNQTEPLNDINIRIGLNKAIDREAALALLEQGNGVVQYGPLSPSQIGYSPDVEEHGYPYDPEGAKALFEEAGYALNADGVYEKDGETLSFTLYTLTIESWVKAAEVVQSMLAEVGVQVEIAQEEQGVVIPMVLGGEYEMTMFGFTSPEADILYQIFHSSQIGGFNYAFVDNPELDALLEATRTSTDPEVRQQAVEDVQIYIAEQAYFIPLYAPINFAVINQRVKDYSFNTFIGLDYTRAIVE